MSLEQNFDCTQFIAFDGVLSDDKNRKLIHLFEMIGFNVILREKISIEKKEYLDGYLREHFYELGNDVFLGEMDVWMNINDEPPKLVFDFISAIQEVNRNKRISNLTVILTSFAQLGKTSEQVYDISIDELEHKLFLMSFNSDVATIDNLILNIK